MSGSVALTDALVQHYLRKRGFTSAAAQLPEPALTEEELERRFPEMQAAVQNRLLLFQAFPGNDYRAAYKLLKDWVHGSLDLYKARPAADEGRGTQPWKAWRLTTPDARACVVRAPLSCRDLSPGGAVACSLSRPGALLSAAYTQRPGRRSPRLDAE